MKTHVAKLITFNALLNITDLLAPKANTHVISIVMPNAIKSGGRSVTVVHTSVTTTKNTNISNDPINYTLKKLKFQKDDFTF